MKRNTIIIIALLCSGLAACNNNSNRPAAGETPTTATITRLSDTTTKSPAVADSSKLRILTLKGKNMTYPEYKALFEEDVASMKPAFILEDIDKDGSNEIIVTYYTGGAHCCDVTTILTKSGENEMKEVMDFTGGTIIAKDTVVLSFFEALGYFHTCYACGINYPESIDATVSLLFEKGIFRFSPPVANYNQQIIKNIQFITSKPIPDKDAEDDGGMDDGTRKAIAMNMVAYYYNNGRKLDMVKKLFDQYYQHKDKAVIWKSLAEYISNFDKDISKSVLMK